VEGSVFVFTDGVDLLVHAGALYFSVTQLVLNVNGYLSLSSTQKRKTNINSTYDYGVVRDRPVTHQCYGIWKEGYQPHWQIDKFNMTKSCEEGRSK